MEDAQKRNEKAEKKKIFFFTRQIKKAAIPVFACISICFMSVWLHGEFVRNQSRWNLQQMKVSAPKETEVFVEKNAGAAPDSINHADKGTGKGQS